MNRLVARVFKVYYPIWALALLVVMAGSLVVGIVPVNAQDDVADAGERIQRLTGYAGVGDNMLYRVPHLKQGETLYIYVTGLSGNLDPFVGLSDVLYESEALTQLFWAEVERIVEEGRDPVKALPEVYNEFLVAWDDDSGEGYDAALTYVIPADGEYQLLISRSPSRDNGGEYSFLIGVDAPQVLTGEAASTGAEIAYLDEAASHSRVYVQETVSTLTVEAPVMRMPLERLHEGDTFYAYAETLSGASPPILTLYDYGEKPLRMANLAGTEDVTTLLYRVEEGGDNFSLGVQGRGEDVEYRLVVGINEPEVLSGTAESAGDPVLQAPIPVQIGVELQQITGVDQVSEKFGAVASLYLEWQDRKLAFSPDTCQCTSRVFTGTEFETYAAGLGIDWPQFTVYNQQGNRWIQNQNAVLSSDGQALYFERFTTDFQAPLFDFTKFPFDTQSLYIQVVSLYSAENFVFEDATTRSKIGELLGEEEWYVAGSETEMSIQDGHYVYTLGFDVQRHLTFYIFRIILPIVLIILVSWFTFFLADYGKRVDVAGANLLVFVAFNFTISGELPRLGYLTFMDAVLIGTFVISALVVVFNVFLKRLELNGKQDVAIKIDKYSLWVYPLAYSIGGILAYFAFLA